METAVKLQVEADFSNEPMLDNLIFHIDSKTVSDQQ